MLLTIYIFGAIISLVTFFIWSNAASDDLIDLLYMLILSCVASVLWPFSWLIIGNLLFQAYFGRM